MAVVVDKTRVSQNSKYSIESKYADRIASVRKPKVNKEDAINRRPTARKEVLKIKTKVKRKPIDYKSNVKQTVRVRRIRKTKE